MRAPESDDARRTRLEAVFGDAGADGAGADGAGADGAGADGAEPDADRGGPGDVRRDDELRRDVPPHHG